MSEVKIIGPNVPNMPWQDRPADKKDKSEIPVWRYSENPIIGRNPSEGVARIFNSAVMPYEGEFIGVFRGEQTNGIPYIYLGRSKDAIHWDFDKEKIPFKDENGNDFMPKYAYDPRLVKVKDTYYIIWCQDFYGAAIGIAKTQDFKTFTRIENPFLPFNRNAVLFPRKINDKFMMLSRPSDSGHTLFFYHGVTGTCNGYVYSIGGAILDIDNPSVVKYRCDTFLLTPEEWYEERGFVPNVTFSCTTIHDAESGKIAIYYGCADTYVGLAFTKVDEIVSYIKEHSVVTEEDTEIGKR